MYAASQHPAAPLPTLLTSLAPARVPHEGKLGDALTAPPPPAAARLQAPREGELAVVRAARPRPAVAPLEDLPEDFAGDFCVRNTFIDAAPLLSPSLEGFYRRREVQTCPSAHAGRLLPLREAPLQAAGPPPGLSTAPPPAAAPAAAAPPAAPPPRPSGAAGGALPSAGSALHASGRCQPCGFFHGKGCDNGAACGFCHLCPPGEKRRRQREKFLPASGSAGAARSGLQRQRRAAGARELSSPWR